MNRILSITKLGNALLIKKAKKVVNINEEILDLIGDMKATLKYGDGVGISAPQVNRSLQIIIIASKPSKNYPDAPIMKATVMMNPEIEIIDERTVKDWEGCLSVPGIRAKVPRYSAIQVKYLTADGLEKTKTYKDFIARIIQHEYDHLEGLSYLDRIDSVGDIISDEEYQKMMNKKGK